MGDSKAQFAADLNAMNDKQSSMDISGGNGFTLGDWFTVVTPDEREMIYNEVALRAIVAPEQMAANDMWLLGIGFFRDTEADITAIKSYEAWADAFMQAAGAQPRSEWTDLRTASEATRYAVGMIGEVNRVHEAIGSWDAPTNLIGAAAAGGVGFLGRWAVSSTGAHAATAGAAAASLTARASIGAGQAILGTIKAAWKPMGWLLRDKAIKRTLIAIATAAATVSGVSMLDNILNPEANDEADAYAQQLAAEQIAGLEAGLEEGQTIEAVNGGYRILDTDGRVLSTLTADEAMTQFGGDGSLSTEPPGEAEPPIEYIRVGRAYEEYVNPQTGETESRGYRAAVRSNDAAFAMTSEEMLQWVLPQYRADDEKNDPLTALRNMSPQSRAAFQQEMVRAGLLEDGKFFEGVADIATQSAMYTVMGQANVDGTDWRTSAAHLARLGDISRERAAADALKSRRFIAPAYQEPDDALLAQSVKQAVAQRLGRDPHDWELALLGEKMASDYRSQYDAEVAAARSEFEAGNRAIVNEEMYESGGVVQDVDPEARLLENIDNLFAKEITNRENAAINRESFRGLQSGLLALEGYVGA